MKELGKEKEYNRLWSDSQSVIHLTKNSTFHLRTKHIQISYHFIRSEIKDGSLKLGKIHTSHNPTNMLIKVVIREKLRFCSMSFDLKE